MRTPFRFLALARARTAALFAAALAFAPGCAKEPDLVVYCALDQIFAEDLVREFEQRTGLVVRAEFDVEAAKTVGLVARLREERNRPRCDVFWNNEIAHTVALAKDGLLAPYASPSASDIPAAFRDASNLWTGFAARARVLIVNTEQVDPSTLHGLADLVDPKWKGKTCMARPLTGTTLTHATALYASRGAQATERWLDELAAGGVNFVQSNGQVMRMVREGSMAFGLTDTDDYWVAKQAGFPVAQVVPDQRDAAHPDAQGTFLIPNTICLLKDAPRPAAGRRFIDFVLSREVEAKLAAADGAQIPLRAGVHKPAHVLDIERLTLIQVDWNLVGEQISARMEQLKGRFLQ
ncbi:MAG: extracellular solute-binding protein [Planctomycetes bacterium]|nr:extracellular solute-binding protein [Planctomycetota bacterium]